MLVCELRGEAGGGAAMAGAAMFCFIFFFFVSFCWLNLNMGLCVWGPPTILEKVDRLGYITLQIKTADMPWEVFN